MSALNEFQNCCGQTWLLMSTGWWLINASCIIFVYKSPNKAALYLANRKWVWNAYFPFGIQFVSYWIFIVQMSDWYIWWSCSIDYLLFYLLCLDWFVVCRSSEEFRNIMDSPDKWKRHTVLSSDSGYSTTDSVDKCGWSPQEVSITNVTVNARCLACSVW